MAAMKVDKLEQCVTSGKDWKEVGIFTFRHFIVSFFIECYVSVWRASVVGCETHGQSRSCGHQDRRSHAEQEDHFRLRDGLSFVMCLVADCVDDGGDGVNLIKKTEYRNSFYNCYIFFTKVQMTTSSLLHSEYIPLHKQPTNLL
jgi:hypothetical protein